MIRIAELQMSQYIINRHIQWTEFRFCTTIPMYMLLHPMMAKTVRVLTNDMSRARFLISGEPM